MALGFLYLVAIIDWASRAVLAWRVSNTMDTAFASRHSINSAFGDLQPFEAVNPAHRIVFPQHDLDRPGLFVKAPRLEIEQPVSTAPGA